VAHARVPDAAEDARCARRVAPGHDTTQEEDDMVECGCARWKVW